MHTDNDETIDPACEKIRKNYEQIRKQFRQELIRCGEDNLTRWRKDLSEFDTHSDLLKEIINDLQIIKDEYNILGCIDPQPLGKELEPVFETYVKALRRLIRDAIAIFSSEELLKMEFSETANEEESILGFLAEIGEIGLFKVAFKKLKTHLKEENIIKLYELLFKAYDGTDLSQDVGLSASRLCRGSFAYVYMAEWMLPQFDDPHTILSQLLKELDKDIIDLPECISMSPGDIDKYKNELYGKMPRSVYEKKAHNFAEKQYERFVTEHQGKHLFYEFIHKHLTKKPDHSFLPSFFLSIVASPSVNAITLSILLLGGLTALAAGTLSIAGIVTGLAMKEAVMVTAAGSIASALTLRGFFASSKDSRLEGENSFLIGATI